MLFIIMILDEMDDHCEEFTQKHLRMMMKELSQVKNDADEKEKRLKEVNMKLEEVVLDAAQKENEKLENLATSMTNPIDRNESLNANTPITDGMEKKISEVSERFFGLIKLLSQIMNINREHDIEFDNKEKGERVCV